MRVSGVQRKDVTMPFMAVNGLRLFYRLRGQGAPVVLLHNGFYSSRTWDGILPALARRYRVLTFDRAGYGASAKPDDFDRDLIEDGVEELRGLVDRLGFARVSLVGHCIGGAIALVFAQRYPEKVERVVAVATGFFSDDKLILKCGLTYCDFARLDPGMRELLADMHGPVYVRTFWAASTRYRTTYIMSRGYDLRPRLAAVKCPVLLVNGDRDFYFDVGHALQAQRLMKFSRLWIVPGCGHDVHLEHKGEFVRNVVSFFAEPRA